MLKQQFMYTPNESIIFTRMWYVYEFLLIHIGGWKRTAKALLQAQRISYNNATCLRINSFTHQMQVSYLHEHGVSTS